MAKRSCGDLFVISEKWLGLIWNYFSNSRGLSTKSGPRVNIEQVQGPFCKVAMIIQFLNYSLMGNGVDPVHCSWTMAVSVHVGPWKGGQ
jgi:hypothetical protein